MRKKNQSVWLLSAYRSSSHASWADWLIKSFSEINWYILELPGRNFRWRIRGNPLSWINQIPKDVPDLILASSMVDLATLKGLHPHIANVPCVYYFHENQFAYPVSNEQHESVDPQMVQLYGALAADKILFNSNYNQDSFLEGIDKLLNKLPDEVPDSITSQIRDKSEILPIVISKDKISAPKNNTLILWNHRWEYDKNPQVFLNALILLKKMNIDFKLALLGDRPTKKPDYLLKIENLFSDKIIINGKVSKEDYRKYISLSTIVVSTAIHEFQGLSMLEAVSAGAIPAVPDDLCYQEQYPDRYRYQANNSEALANFLASYLNKLPEAPDVSFWSSEKLIEKWRNIFSYPNS